MNYTACDSHTLSHSHSHTHTHSPPLSNPQLVSTNTYEVLTADNCCCGTCRMLGWDNYDALRDLIDGIDSALKKCSNNRCRLCVCTRARGVGARVCGHRRIQIHGNICPRFGVHEKTALLSRVDKEERFRRGSYVSHLKNQSTDARHCKNYLCSSVSNVPNPPKIILARARTHAPPLSRPRIRCVTAASSHLAPMVLVRAKATASSPRIWSSW